MPKRKADQNLNNKVECEERKRQKVYSRGTNKFSVHFDGTGIRSAVMRTIKDEGTKYVVGCVAWFSNKRILAELAKKRGVCVVVTKDKLTKTKTNQAAYKRLKPCYRGGTIRVVGAGRGRFKSLMHHKFLIGLDANREPKWVMNGSFNMTQSAMTNLENLMIMHDSAIAGAYFEEFKRVAKISTPLKLS
jgi:hypothetical protein